jgi:hypothetical protein
VCHVPPGTSKWNKIEHRLFSHISTNWRGRPLVSHEVIVELIAATGPARVCGSTRNWTRADIRSGSRSLTGSWPRCRCAATTGTGKWNYTVLPTAAQRQDGTLSWPGSMNVQGALSAGGTQRCCHGPDSARHWP